MDIDDTALRLGSVSAFAASRPSGHLLADLGLGVQRRRQGDRALDGPPYGAASAGDGIGMCLPDTQASAPMVEITYVSIVPKASSARLRQVLSEEDTGPLQWREARAGRCSEFYFTGPPDLVRRTHEFVTLWLANQNIAKLAGKTAEAPSLRPWRAAAARAAAAAAALVVFAAVAFAGSGALG